MAHHVPITHPHIVLKSSFICLRYAVAVSQSTMHSKSILSVPAAENPVTHARACIIYALSTFILVYHLLRKEEN